MNYFTFTALQSGGKFSNEKQILGLRLYFGPDDFSACFSSSLMLDFPSSCGDPYLGPLQFPLRALEPLWSLGVEAR